MESVQLPLSAEAFLESIQACPLERKKEALDKKIAELVQQKILFQQKASSSLESISSVSRDGGDASDKLELIETILSVLKKERKKLKSPPSRQKLESQFHKIMHSGVNRGTFLEFVKFFRLCASFQNKEVIKEILSTEPNFKIDSYFGSILSQGGAMTAEAVEPVFKVTLLTLAVKFKDQQIVSELVQLGANINGVDGNGQSALIWAVHKDDLQMVHHIVHLGGKTDLVDGKGFTPLTFAVLDNKPKMVAALIDAQADINGVDGNGVTPLMLAVQNRNVKMVEQLVGLRADKNCRSGDGWTPLTWAVENNDQDMVRCLVTSGFDINYPGKNGWTPLTLAVQNRNLEMVKLLAELHVDLNRPDMNGWTPLTKAVKNINFEMVKLLVELGVDKYCLYPNGSTVLTDAVRNKDRVMVQFLAGIEFDLNRPDKNGMTPFSMAFVTKNREMVQTLYRMGLDMNLDDGHMMTFIARALVDKDREMIALLREYSPVLISNEKNVVVAITYAAIEKNRELLQLLRELGFDSNKIGVQGMTPLTNTIKRKQIGEVRFLLENGADVNKIDSQHSPLCLARLLRSQPIEDLLLGCPGIHHQEADQLFLVNTTAVVTGLYGKVSFEDQEGQEHTIELEGGIKEFATAHLFQTISSFFSSGSVSDAELSRQAKERITTALDFTQQIQTNFDSVPVQDLVAKIREGKAVAFCSGWTAHSISIVFSDNKMFVCNRGNGLKEHAVMAYQLNPDLLTEECIIKLKNCQYANAEEFEKFLHEQPAIGASIREECLDMKWQKVGNCTWANTKAILFVLLYLELKKERPMASLGELQMEARRMYKAWSAHVRFDATKRYVESPIEQIVPAMLTKLREKTASYGSFTPEQRTYLIDLLDRRIEGKTKFLAQAGRTFPDTEEIKAMKEAVAACDLPAMRQLAFDAYKRNNRALEGILRKYIDNFLRRLNE